MTAIDSSKSSRLGYWLESKRGAGIVYFAIIPVLVVLALLLPPISIVQRISGLGSTRITEAGGVVSDPDGSQVIITPGAASRPFRATLSSVPRITFLEGSAGGDLKEAAAAIPTRLMAKSPFYQLKVSGEVPSQSTWVMPIPNDSEPYETLDLYTWDAPTQSWQWLPHRVIPEDDQVESRLNAVPLSAMIVQTNPEPSLISADAAEAKALPAEALGALAQIHPTGLQLGDGGSLSGALDATFDQLGGSYAVMPVIRNYDGPIVRSDLLANMLIDSEQRQTHVEAIVNTVVGNSYQGVDIDYRGLDKNLRGEFNQFIKDLAEQLHAQGKTLGVRVEAPSQVSEDTWDTGPYDWQALGLIADSIKIPAPVDPQAYSTDGQFDALLKYAVGQVNRYKLQILLSGQSVERAGSYLLPKTYSDALQPLLGRVESDVTVVEPGKPINLALVSSRPNSGLVYDPNIGTYVYRYQDDQGNARTVWLENAASLAHKLEILKQYNAQGFTLERLPADGLDTDLWSLMRDYQQGSIKPIESNLAVEWTLTGPDGQKISQVRPLTEPNLVVQAPQGAGELQVQAAIVDRGQVLQTTAGTPIAIATYTPTPTPTPELTPTPEATPTPVTAELAVTSPTLNVRSGPGTAYPRVGQIRRGETYTIVGRTEAGDWWQVTYDGKPGWVSSDLVTVNGPVDSVAMVEVAAAPTAAPQAATSAKAASSSPARSSGASSGFGYGLQTPNWDVASLSAKVRGAGFNWVKFQTPWKDLEGSAGSIDWGGLDGTVNTANAAGLKVLLSVPKAPAWARPGNTDMNVEGPPADPATYANFVGQLAGRYCGKVHAIEVWNEQNLWYEWGNQALSAADYVRLLSAAYNAIKSACPQTTVVSGALTPTGAPPPAAVDDMTYLEQMYQAGLKNVSDAIGAHPSGFNVSPDVGGGQAACDFIRSQGSQFVGPCNSPHHSWSFRATMEGYRNIMAKYGDGGKKIWPTEFGWASGWLGKPGYEYANDNTPDEQAQYTVRAYQMMKNWGWVGPAFLWNLGYTDADGGQWNIDGRSTYAALQAMPK
jgi:uncharacterized protein YraI